MILDGNLVDDVDRGIYYPIICNQLLYAKTGLSSNVSHNITVTLIGPTPDSNGGGSMDLENFV